MEKKISKLIEKISILTRVQVAIAWQNLNQVDQVMALRKFKIAQKDIAEILGISVNSVTSIVSRKESGKKKKKEGINKA